MARQETFLKSLLEHERDIRAFNGSIVRRPTVCDEVFQDVALTLWEQFDRYDPRRSFGAWARGIARNKILQRLRRDRRFPVLLSPEAISAVLEAFDRTEQRASARTEALQECLQALPPNSRELLRLRYGGGPEAPADRRRLRSNRGGGVPGPVPHPRRPGQVHPGPAGRVGKAAAMSPLASAPIHRSPLWAWAIT